MRPSRGFLRPSLGFRCGKSILHTDNLSLFLTILNSTFLMQVVLSAILSHLLPVQV